MAGVLSFFIPGLGHIYKGRVAAGIGFLVFTVFGYALFIVPGLVLHLAAIVTAVSGPPARH